MFSDSFNKNITINAFSEKPFTFLNPQAHDNLAAIIEINLIENGSRASRENWQLKQLNNLFEFAFKESVFWNSRIPNHIVNFDDLKNIPTLSRAEVSTQVSKEGSLMKNYISSEPQAYSSSGSTGTAVRVYCCPQNGRYNELRSLAQYFIEERYLNDNRTFIKPADGDQYLRSENIFVEHFDNWLGDLNSTFQSGKYKIIHFAKDEDALLEEILKDRVGYLACLGSHMDILLKKYPLDLKDKLGVRMWLHHSDNQDQKRIELLSKLEIPISSSYSSSEVGPIAVECYKSPGNYHVVHSNVIVEIDNNSAISFNGEVVHKLLITHIHSYATPIIRYDIGDYATFKMTCPCGHDGITLSNIYGRSKFFIKKLNGELIPFRIFSKPLSDIISFKEFFISQPDLNTIAIEISGVLILSDEEKTNITKFIHELSDNSFNVQIKLVKNIDWSKNPKRLPFISYV
jgi:phenylacetate-coenzyme A ligase PaaK-like adenylate-forming protein